jgi:tRNA 2-thiouridine synthesizing protein A
MTPLTEGHYFPHANQDGDRQDVRGMGPTAGGFGAASREQLEPPRLACLLNRPVARILLGMSETLLDVKGMNCPLPVLKANRILRGMAAGERLRVLATDRAAVADFQAFCRETGHALLAWSDEAGVFSFVIRRRADDPEKEGS